MICRAQSCSGSASQYRVGTGKPSLRRLSTCAGTICSSARRSAYFVVSLVTRWSTGSVLGDLEDLGVQERHPQLQRVGHRHLVGLDQDVAAQPGEQVDVLHRGDVVVARGPGAPVELAR